MKSTAFHLLFFLALFLSAGFSSGWEWNVGEVNFPTSTTSQEAQMLFNRGVALLHNFWFEEARHHFSLARSYDPRFPMSFWGEAFACKQGLWETEQYEEGKKVLEELDLLGEYSVTEKEELLIEAVRIIFGNGTVIERDQQFALAMGKIYEKYPKDIEVATFYSLSLLTLVGSERGMLQRGAQIFPLVDGILDQVLSVAPHHPGGLHYRIHNLDTPLNSSTPKAWDAAAKYGPAAPTSPHALHMPCHTYLRSGMWLEAMHANELSINAADMWLAHRKLPISFKDYHSIEYQHYVYLHQGRFWTGMQFVDLNFIVAEDMDSFYHFIRGTLMEARQLAEASFWSLQRGVSIDLDLPERITCPTCENPAFMDGFYWTTIQANTAAYFSRGLVAATKGDASTANASITFLKQEAELIYPIRPPHGDNTLIMILQIEGVLSFEQGSVQAGLEKLKEAFEWETKIDPPKDGPPQPIIPSFETYARYLLKAGRSLEAIEVLKSGNFTSSRNRAQTTFMAAKAQQLNGDVKEACHFYRKFAHQFDNNDDDSIGELVEARSYLKTNCKTQKKEEQVGKGEEKEAGKERKSRHVIPKAFEERELEVEGPRKRKIAKMRRWDFSDWENVRHSAGHC